LFEEVREKEYVVEVTLSLEVQDFASFDFKVFQGAALIASGSYMIAF